MLIGLLYIFFGDISIQIFCPFLKFVIYLLLLRVRYVLHILETSLYPVYELLIFSSHFMNCFFTCLIASFNTQIFFNFGEVQFGYFVIVACTFDVISKTTVVNPRSWRLNLIFLIFYYFSLYIWSLINFELIYSNLSEFEGRVQIILLDMAIQLSSTISWKDSSSHLNCFDTLVGNKYKCQGLFLDSQFFPLIYILVFRSAPYCWLLLFLISFEMRSESSSFFFLSVLL